MRIGLFLLASAPLQAIISQVESAERDGFASAWLPNIFAHDALTVLALAGQHTTVIELGVGVVPTYPRHPAALAQQALTVQAATGNRLLLGIGPSHQVVIEQMMGLSYAKPVPHMRDYVRALTALLSGQPAQFRGDHYQVNLQLSVPQATPPPVMIAALRPHMLRLAGQLADGTLTWMGGPRYLQDVAVPAITQAARDAGRSAPRVVVGLPVAVTNKPDAARAAASRIFAVYATLPAYRAVLDIEGAKDAADVALIGTEAEVECRLGQLAAIGATDLVAVVFDISDDPGARERTYDFLAGVARSHKPD
jgi:F420-dependent oxidoreductase-like protein